MKYRSGYKYQLAEDLIVQTDICPEHDIDIQFIRLRTNGELLLRSGYASDGPSGTTFDYPKKHVMDGAFVHDGLCQLFRMKWLPQDRELIIKAHKMARKIWIAKGMWKWRAEIWYRALLKLADSAVDPKNVKKIYEV